MTQKQKSAFGRVENIVENGEMLVTSVFSFSHNVFKWSLKVWIVSLNLQEPNIFHFRKGMCLQKLFFSSEASKQEWQVTITKEERRFESSLPNPSSQLGIILS